MCAEASAAAFNVEARTETQAYDIRAYRGTTPSDVTLLPRRRVVQYLGVNGYELVTGQDLGFETNLRIYSDFGLPRGEADVIDGLRTEDADLMYANVRYRTGGFEGVIGRQYFIDTIDYFSIDGLRLRYVLPKIGLGVEAYGGLWVRSASFLGTSFSQLDGVPELEGNLTARQLALNPYYQDLNAVEPVFGARLLGVNVLGSGVSGSVGYRRSFQSGATTSERLSADLTYGKGRGLNLLGSFEYDLILNRIAGLRALGRYDANLFAAQIEALRIQPTYTSYSIWYYFAAAPRDELRVRGDLTPLGPLRYYAQLSATHYNLDISDALGLSNVVLRGDAGNGMSWGAQGGAQFSWSPWRAAVDVSWQNGWGGRQFWVNATGGYHPLLSRWSLDGRFSFADIRDQYNAALYGNFYGGQLWGSYDLASGARASLVVEENINPYANSDTKVFLVFDLKAVL